MTEKLELLETTFKRKDYIKVVQLIRDDVALQFEKIRDDDQAEVCALASFSYFNLNEFSLASSYSKILLDHLRENNQKEVARDLYENLVIVRSDSLMHMGKIFAAYLFIREHIREIIKEKDALKNRFARVRDLLSVKASKFLNYFFPALGFAVLIVQQIFHVFGVVPYMFILVGLILLIAIRLGKPNAFEKLIRALL